MTDNMEQTESLDEANTCETQLEITVEIEPKEKSEIPRKHEEECE